MAKRRRFQIKRHDQLFGSERIDQFEQKLDKPEHGIGRRPVLSRQIPRRIISSVEQAVTVYEHKRLHVWIPFGATLNVRFFIIADCRAHCNRHRVSKTKKEPRLLCAKLFFRLRLLDEPYPADDGQFAFVSAANAYDRINAASQYQQAEDTAKDAENDPDGRNKSQNAETTSPTNVTSNSSSD